MPQILEHIWQMEAPQIVLWGLFLFQRHPHREAIGGGVLVTVGGRNHLHCAEAQTRLNLLI